MTEYRFKFKKNKTLSDKETCPRCEHSRTFTRYVDTYTGELLPKQYGKCERVNNCGYELNPYADGYAKGVEQQEPIESQVNAVILPPQPPVFIPNEVKEASRKAYDQNNFVKYLHTLFDALEVEAVVRRYQIGTSNYWKGATVFWIIDINGNVRAGQVKHFDTTGHTTKDLTSDGKKPRTTWMHSILEHKQPPPWPQWLRDYVTKCDNKVSCLFGEHLLMLEPTKVVCVVEAPKTAIIASLYFPQFIWLATMSLSYLTADRCKALEGKKVILWPDLKAFDKWQEKADKLSAGLWKVSDFLEKEATEEESRNGLDLADFLPRIYYKDFRLGFPHQWNEPAPVGYISQCKIHTPESLGLLQAISPPITEQDLMRMQI